MLPIYYINLASRPDRRAFMERQLLALNLEGRRIEALTAEDITQDDADRYCNPERPSFLRKKVLACTLSHEQAWKAMLADGHAAALFLEDDAVLSPLLPSFLAEPGVPGVDLIRIEKSHRIRVYPARHVGASGITFREFRSTPMGAAGYVLTARAAGMLFGHPGLRMRPVDVALYDPFEQPGSLLTRVITEPALCRQLGTHDPLASAGRSDLARDRVKHTFSQKHPLAHMLMKLWRSFKSGTRNAADHMAQMPKGLQRRAIRFEEGIAIQGDERVPAKLEAGVGEA